MGRRLRRFIYTALQRSNIGMWRRSGRYFSLFVVEMPLPHAQRH
jgi:hypothetical protein